MKNDLDKRKAALWGKLERARRIRIPQDLRNKWEQDAGFIPGEDEITLEDLKSYAEERLDELALLRTVNYFAKRKEVKESESGKHYGRCFEKRLYLVEFVMKRFLMDGEGGQSVLTSYQRRTSKRIDWKRTCLEWNDAHPSDPMSPEVLKVRYYRAIAQVYVQREYLNRRFPSILNRIWDELGVPPWSVNLVFGDPEGKHSFTKDIALLTALEELALWQDQTEWMFSGKYVGEIGPLKDEEGEKK